MAMGRSAVALIGSWSPHSLAAVANAMASRTARSPPRSSSAAGSHPRTARSPRRRAGEKNRSAAIPGEESRPISLYPAPQRLGPYGKIVRSRSQHMSGERQHPRVSAMDPIIVVQRTRAPAGRQGRAGFGTVSVKATFIHPESNGRALKGDVRVENVLGLRAVEGVEHVHSCVRRDDPDVVAKKEHAAGRGLDEGQTGLEP